MQAYNRPTMTSLWPQLEPLLADVQRPARYIGCEHGALRPVWSAAKVAWLLVYPDVYDVGLPNQGLQVLYGILNERADALAERAYLPWTDLIAALRRHGVPLFSVDTHRAATEFDVVGFNLSSELVCTNVLECLDLAGLPVRSEHRTAEHPIVIAGGHVAANPEPLADFVDAFVLGDGEEVVGEITEVVADWKRAGRPGREEVLHRLALVPGVYVPSMYRVDADGPVIRSVTPRFPDVPAVVRRRVVADLAAWPYPRRPLVPLTDVVHDRLSVEVFRGCTRGCRFCQAGMITRPVRERPVAQVLDLVTDGLRSTGYDEVSLMSLSTADHSALGELIGEILRGPAADGRTTVALPSLRVDAFTVGLAAHLHTGRRSGLTFAPEAGTWRLRQVINKAITDEDLDRAAEAAFAQGWHRIKLYFLTGLPTETDEDTDGIVATAARCAAIGRRSTPRATVAVSVAGLVPKPHTPFQWFGQATAGELHDRMRRLRDAARRARGVELRWRDPEVTVIEGLLARGDRRLGRVVERVWRAGGVFQEWGEHFSLDRWTAALAAEGLSLDWEVHRHRDHDEILPWDHLAAGPDREFLWEDWQAALAGRLLDDCRWAPCTDCGSCPGGPAHVLAGPGSWAGPPGRSRGAGDG